MAKYDVIVVGAGPGGTVAAKTAADKKLNVLLIERARTPGEKNMSGSYLFRDLNTELWPGFLDQDFHKGHVRIGGITFIWSFDNDAKRYGITAQPGGYAIRDMMTVFRPETDKWFAEQAVKAGAELKTALATDVIWDNKPGETPRVVGVVTDKGNFEAPIVIDASGLHSTLARRTGLTNWGTNKIMLALKYIYKLDGDIIRKRLQTYYDTDGVETDWGAMPTMAGSEPEFYGTHCVGEPGRGLINVIVYGCLEEMVKAKTNIHQRMQWYIKQAPVSQLLEGAEFIYCNFHSLTSGDLVGYPQKAYVPGLVLVGDAGGFSQVVDNFGANVAETMGKIAGELAAEMKAKKDYSEEMFAKYDANWRETFIGEDNVPEMNMLMRGGGFQKLVGAVDEAMSTFFIKRMKNTAYPSIIFSVMPKMLPALPALIEMPYALKNTMAAAVKKAGGLMALFGMNQDK
ncbi:MAG TPA: NAD(P)/FAD-dependent oxidoreductase [Anaerolineales bacterium]